MYKLKLSSALEEGFFFIYHAARALLIVTPVLLWVSCDDTVYVDISSQPSVERKIVDRILAAELPEGFCFTDEKAKAGLSIVAAISDWTHGALAIPDSKTQPITANSRWYAPEVPFASTVFEVSAAEAEINCALRPLESITLPQRGVAVDGLYPGETGYPLRRDTVLFVEQNPEIGAEAETVAKLESWLGSFSYTDTDPGLLWFAAVGDMMPGRGVSSILQSESGLDTVFSDTLPYLENADILAGNLEGAVTNGGRIAEKSYTFRFAPEILKPLKKAGFDYLSLTNNHSYDFGKTGFLDTLNHLEESGIKTSGAGIDPVSASEPSNFTVNGAEIRILSIGAYPPERNGFDGMRIASVNESRPGILWADENGLKAVKSAFSKDSFNILMVHGGIEWSTKPSPEQRELYHRFIELGADAVIGSHPHYLHGFETYKGGLIAHSLGNFIFPGMEETAYGEESLILLLGISDGKIRYLRPVPVQIDGKRLSVDRSGKILERVFQRTAALQETSS